MTAEIQFIDQYAPEYALIRHAAQVLEKGGVIIYPTDTIYGMAVDMRRKAAIERLFKIKQMDRQKLLSFICNDLQTVSQWAFIPNAAYRVMRRVLPGPYTFILPASKEVPKTILDKRQTVGIRIPDSAVALNLVNELGSPLLSTSVPMGPDGFHTDLLQITAEFSEKVDLILNAGDLIDTPSTIVDFTTDPPTIIREGAGDIAPLL
ncbi:MAG: L-threonylcarbamoyladenylate synthase [Acidobacteriota bacterium]|jgi:tRNA threonylcarbamoyl adenosine modification protein (Sua5/YciO/YrdC/YwlC family)|nr:L-threonylcarbamoyladenylate synthase [Acidobacteriota bacterium]